MTDPGPLPRRPAELTARSFGALVGDDSITAIRVERVGEGFGLESVVARVDAEGADGTRSYACKFCTADAARGERLAFEQVLAPTRVRRPGFVGDYVDGDEGVVVTEFVDGRQGDVLAGCEPAVARSVVGSIAELHARWWGRAPIEVPALDERLRRNLSAEHVEGCIELHHDVLTERARRLMRGLPDRVDDLADELGRMPMTVVHGDLHLDNVIIGHDGTATILDWGRPRRAAAAVDVARCFLEVTDAHPDDDRGRAFLATYLDTLRMREVDVDPTGFRTMIDVAQLAFAPGIIRWAASSRPAPGTRPWSLLRNALTRWTAYWSPA